MSIYYEKVFNNRVDLLRNNLLGKINLNLRIKPYFQKCDWSIRRCVEQLDKLNNKRECK